MPLDPQLRALLTGTAAPTLPPLDAVSAVEARALQRETALRARGPDHVPEAVAATRSLGIPGPGGELRARCYRPRDERPRLPAVLYLHGGGWVLGDLDVQDPTCRRLANATGAVVVALAYRLAPEHPYPAALDDVCATIRWLHTHAHELAIVPDRVAVAGSSAGGTLAAAATVRLRDEGGPALWAQLLLYPPTDPLLASASVTENAVGYYLTAEDMRRFVAAYLPDPATRAEAYAGPLHAPSLAGLPAAVVTTAGFDPLRDEGVGYAERLRAAGVPVSHLHYPDLIHGYFGFADRVTACARARDEVLAEFAASIAR